MLKSELNARRQSKTVIGKQSEHRYLIIVCFARSAKRLPANPFALLYNTALDNSKNRVSDIFQKVFGTKGCINDESLSFPFAVSQKMMQITEFVIEDNHSYPFHVFTRTWLSMPVWNLV